jgi:ArsR family transcriptional regulator, arsenate/arsenite/antimonite-responsive transcriptional repressor / arsenate reductase (thioredoxin)
MAPPPADAEPPAVFGLLAHPLRWRLLQQLVASDRTVGELTELVGESQNLVSYHLRHLHDGGLVVRHRSAADGRDVYYAIDLAHGQAALRDSVQALHPALWLADGSRPRRSRRRRVLFLCTGNSARSQMAEALTVHLSQGRVAAWSAGSHPKPLHPNAVRVMHERGIDISAQHSKHLDRFRTRSLDLVVTLCDRVREVCPEFSAHPERVHWSIPDPATPGASDRDTYPAFERTATDLETRITYLTKGFSHA